MDLGLTTMHPCSIKVIYEIQFADITRIVANREFHRRLSSHTNCRACRRKIFKFLSGFRESQARVSIYGGASIAVQRSAKWRVNASTRRRQRDGDLFHGGFQSMWGDNDDPCDDASRVVIFISASK